MASKVISIQEEHILKLILEFLISRKHYKPARSLEKETRVKTNAYSENISFFRDLVLDGDWAAVKEFGEPLADVPAFEYCKFNFLVVKQEYLEILFEKYEGNVITDELALRDRLLACLQNLERYCTSKEEYNKLYWYLSVSSLRNVPEFYKWSVDSSRMQLFEEMLELLKQFIPVGEPNGATNNYGSEDRLLVLLCKGSLYENCIEFCHKQAMGKTGAPDLLTDIKVDLFRKQSLKSTGNFYSWLHSLSKKSFIEPFEELNFDIQVSKYKQSRLVAEVKDNSLSQSLTIELKSPTKALLQRGRVERSKRLSDFPTIKPPLVDFNIKDVSQSFAEFECFENDRNQCSLLRCPNFNQRSVSDDQEVFLQGAETIVHLPTSHASTNKATESPTKAMCDQQKFVLQQLEEHKQRQQELYDQLAESASLAKLGSGVKDALTNDFIPDGSSTGLEALKKNIENLKLLPESYESPKDSKTGPFVHRDGAVVSKANHCRSKSPRCQSFQKDTCPDTLGITTEIQERKNFSSISESAILPKTPVNTYLPPGMVKLTDGSGTFYSRYIF